MDSQIDIPGNTTGKILIANDHLNSPPFGESLVFMAEHDSHGAMGFIVNRPAHRTLADMIPDGPPGLERIPVYFGGPVQPESMLLVCFKQGNTPNQILTSSIDDLTNVPELIHNENTWIRGFMGYAGWTGGQLEAELLTDAWKISLPHPALFNEAYAPGLWHAYYSEDPRWQKLVDYLPEDPGRN